jgi:hypothetical protein
MMTTRQVRVEQFSVTSLQSFQAGGNSATRRGRKPQGGHQFEKEPV